MKHYLPSSAHFSYFSMFLNNSTVMSVELDAYDTESDLKLQLKLSNYYSLVQSILCTVTVVQIK